MPGKTWTRHSEWMRRIEPLRAPGVTNREIAQQLGTTDTLISYHIRKAGLWSQRRSAFCPNGHRYDQEGFWYDGRGTRRCRACRRALWAKERLRKSPGPKRDDRYSEAEIAALRRLAAEGLSATEIAKAMPNRTRSSVKHKIHRLGIKTTGHVRWKRTLARDAFK